MTFVSLLSACLVIIFVPCSRTNCEWKRFRWARCIVLAAVLLATIGLTQGSQAQIEVTPNSEGNTLGVACSLHEGIASGLLLLSVRSCIK